jgi:hypothetical protein
MAGGPVTACSPALAGGNWRQGVKMLEQRNFQLVAAVIDNHVGIVTGGGEAGNKGRTAGDPTGENRRQQIAAAGNAAGTLVISKRVPGVGADQPIIDFAIIITDPGYQYRL